MSATGANSTVHGEAFIALMMRLRSQGIADGAMMKLLEATPHERFVPAEHYKAAWGTQPVPIACGQTLHPVELTVRFLLALAPEPSHAVLEIGTGSGFQTAMLAALAKKVHSIDRYRSLIRASAAKLASLGHANTSFEQGDGRTGGRETGLYDRVVCDSAFPGMPRDLLDKTASGGVVVTAIGAPGEEQMAVRLTKIGSRFEREDLFPVRFGPLESGVAAAL